MSESAHPIATAQQSGSGQEFIGVNWLDHMRALLEPIKQSVADLKDQIILSKKAADEAKRIAEDFQSTRFESFNEFNARIDSILKETVTRNEFVQSANNIAGKIDVLERKVDESRQAFEKRLTTMEASKSGATESKNESRENKGERQASLGLVIGIAAAMATVIPLLLTTIGNLTNRGVTPPVAAEHTPQLSIPPGYMLVPSQQQQTSK